MIYLITGVPGSGKTLYAVSTHVQALAGQKIKHRGAEITRRVVVDGIKGLVLPHELMAPGVEDADGNMEPGEGDGVWNWFEWCKPGDVIVIDEVQRWWRPRGMNLKPPKMIKALETHRHMGVDFVVITQNPMLMDQNVRRLVGRHQNIRRLLGGARAIIYDWDSCAVNVLSSKGASTSLWNYPKKAFALYKSSELHTKQKFKIPLWFYLPLLAALAFVFVAPKAYSTMSGAMSGKGVSSRTVDEAADPSRRTVSSAADPSRANSLDGKPPLDPSRRTVPEPLFAGCVSMRGECQCVDDQARRVVVPLAVCIQETGGGGPVARGNLDAIEAAHPPAVYPLPDRIIPVDTRALAVNPARGIFSF